MRLLCLAIGVVVLVALAAGAPPQKPHIFFVLVDDFGWAEVGYHRNGTEQQQVHTPTIDSLVQEGVELNRHYVFYMCTPTRSSMQSGRIPAHVLLTLSSPCQPNGGIPKNMTGIAEKMKDGGYKTHLVGKWDAGMATPTHTPKGRGYDTSLNYFGHGNWMWTEYEWQGSFNNRTTWPECNEPTCFKDFWDTDKPAIGINGTGYEEEIFRNRVASIIQEHDPNDPLFLVYTPKVGHYPLQAPLEYQKKFNFIDQPNRRVYHAMVAYLDDNLKNMTDLLKAKGMWNNTLMVLSSDNGGYVKAEQGDCYLTQDHGYACFNGEAGANNYPLRGGKYSPFEGGVRVNAFASGGFLPQSVRGTRQDEMIHIADWYATFAALAGVDPTDHRAAASGLPPIDSVDVWPLLSGQVKKSPRPDYLINANAYIKGDYKVLKGNVNEANWGGPEYPNATTAHDPISNYNLDCSNGCLFNVAEDPHERNDLAQSNPSLLKQMLDELEQAAKSIYPHNPGKEDPACKQAAMNRYQGFYGPFMDLDSQQ